MKKALLSYYSLILQCILLFISTYIILCNIYTPVGYYVRRLLDINLKSDWITQAIIIELIVFPILLYTIWNNSILNKIRRFNFPLITLYFFIIIISLILLAKSKINLYFSIFFIPIIMFILSILWLFLFISYIKSIILKYIIIEKSEYNRIIEEKVKSERFKTELITNVSHDIKTPLTSIINYIDLIKRLKIQNESLNEYIEILDRKSNRLKMLINDLIEASKAGTGNISVNLQQIDLVEITGQIAGEFDSLFIDAELEFIFRHTEEKMFVVADSRHLWRVLENIFGNAIKYALPNTRIYTDIKKEKDYILFSLKNISKEPLGISSDELMEQFVRGDRSRHSEGSGLGLYIAKSLTELMGIYFEIIIAGDLFEVIIKLNNNF